MACVQLQSGLKSTVKMKVPRDQFTSHSEECEGGEAEDDDEHVIISETTITVQETTTIIEKGQATVETEALPQQTLPLKAEQDQKQELISQNQKEVDGPVNI